MLKNLPLKGKTVILTGTTRTKEILTDIQSLGGESVFAPLIETKEKINVQDASMLEQLDQFEWLIFTSQNAVDAFRTKLNRHQWNLTSFQGKFAAVGIKTANLLEELGLQVSFMPTVYSADVFVKEFPIIAGENPKCLFLRGSKAKDTLKKGLPFELIEWTVYETIENKSNVQLLTELVLRKSKPIVIFASPSAVDVYAKYISPNTLGATPFFAAIGHVTAERIEHFGGYVTYLPKVYTMQAVIEEIIQREEEFNHDRT